MIVAQISDVFQYVFGKLFGAYPAVAGDQPVPRPSKASSSAN
jgi:predicted CDP-diglyceride synthetase/phosphatidate cytidylyltransferase